MKTAEEWVLPVLNAICDSECPNLIEIFKQIQLDAYKAGMTEAADIVAGFPTSNATLKQSERDLVIKQTILSTRDNKETV